MRPRVALLVAVAAVGVLAAGFFIFRGLFVSFSSPLPTADAVRTDFVRRVYADGELKAVKATPLNAPSGVRGAMKIAWIAEDGQRVGADQVIVRFDPTELEKQLADGQDDAATAGYKTRKRSLEKDNTLDGLDSQVAIAERELYHAREFQSRDALIFSRNEIVESEIDERLATQKKETAVESRPVQERMAGADLAMLAIDARVAGIRIGQAEGALQSLEVRAPHEGILVLRRDWRGETPRVGESVWSGYPLADIPELSEMQAEIYVLEADGGGLEPGQSATVRMESRPEVPVEATVRRVDTLAKPRIRGVPVQYFAVTLALASTDPATMKPGQRVQAEIVLDRRDDVVVVPREAVFDEEGRRVVYRRRAGGFEPVEVTLGPVALGRVVIEEGLEAGDTVALAHPERSGRDEGAVAPPVGALP